LSVEQFLKSGVRPLDDIPTYDPPSDAGLIGHDNETEVVILEKP
jgi:hypothetical protein